MKKTIKRMFLSLAAISAPFMQATAEESGKGRLGEFAAQLQPLDWTLIWISVCLFGIIIYLGYFLKTVAYEKFVEGYRKGAKVAMILILGVAALFGFSPQAMANSGDKTDPETIITMMLLLVLIAVQIVVILYLWSSIGNLLKKEVSYPLDKPYLRASTVWGAIWENVNQSVSLEKEKDVMLDHAYDGIRELDNDLPPWWKWGFYITIIFAVIYLARYHVFQTAPLQIEEYEIAVARAEADLAERRATSPQINEETVVFLDSEEDLNIGQSLYVTNCAVCHGQLGEGGIGPNMTDDYWIHGGSIRDIFRVTKYGVIEKGMTPWQDILTPLEMAQVSSYVKTMRETDPPNQKEAEGELYIADSEEEPAAEQEAPETEE